MMRSLQRSLTAIYTGVERKTSSLAFYYHGATISNREIMNCGTESGLSMFFFILVAIFSSPSSVIAGDSDHGCKVGLADIVFMLDDSSSIWPNNFTLQKNFVNQMINSFDIAPDATHVAVVTFSTRARLQFRLNEMMEKDKLREAVFRIRQRGGDTNTGDALNLARTYAFSRSQGGRPGKVPQIGIVITDGKSQVMRQTTREARLAKEQGIILFAVGIGEHVSQKELRSIASGDDFIFENNDYATLSKIETQLQQKACEIPIPTEVKVGKNCRNKELDLIFAVDVAKPIYKIDYFKTLAFVQSVMYSMDLGDDKGKVSVIAFGNHVEPAYQLGEHNSYSKNSKSLFNIKQMDGPSDFASVLQYARSRGFNERYGARKSAAQVLVLVTDGKSADFAETVRQAERTKTARIRIFVVGIGPDVNTGELEAIASMPARYHVYKVDNVDQLAKVKTSISRKICSVSGPVQLEACGRRKGADIAFVMNTENAIAKDVVKTRAFMKNITTSFNMGKNKIKVAALPTKCNSVPGFRLNEGGEDKKVALEKIGADTNKDALTALLTDVRTDAFEEKNGARKGVKKIAIVVTDNKPENPRKTLLEAMKTKMSDVEIFVIGVGKEVDSKLLKNIASTPTERHVAFVPNYSTLHETKEMLVDNVCEELENGS
ncbi:matrilin-1-like [Tubulanus polymorphus]|uniref:matrilin-1-like n=1 Tax=Tubulanus polymorphus TaxID=672921 RepID=UPI003DA3E1DA